MLKYIEYIKESIENPPFKVNDEVIFQSSPERSMYSQHNGKICKITYIYPENSTLGFKDSYQLKTSEGQIVIAKKNEIRPITASPTTTQKSVNYIENQFNNTKNDFYIGQRVIVNGTEGRITFENRRGTIKRISMGECLIEFDDNDSKNKVSMMVSKDIIKPLDEPSINVLKVGDIVICTDKKNELVGQRGEVTKIWPDGEGLVDFIDHVTGIKTITSISPEDVKIITPSKNKTFQTTSSKTSSSSTNIPVTTTNSIEEEDEDDVMIKKQVTFNKKDLLEFSYKDFFLEEKISSKEDILKNKKKYEDSLMKQDISEFKKSFFERSLKSAEIVEQYFDFLSNKVAKELPVYRTVEQIDNDDLLTTKTKVRASESKEITRKHSFDQGIIAYWKFKDSVVFKTI